MFVNFATTVRFGFHDDFSFVLPYELVSEPKEGAMDEIRAGLVERALNFAVI